MEKPFSKYILHVLDEAYRIIPPEAELVNREEFPPEEWEIRDCLADYYECRIEIENMSFFSKLLNLKKYSLMAAYCMKRQDDLSKMINSSPMHKAAMLRLMKASDISHMTVLYAQCLKTNKLNA